MHEMSLCESILGILESQAQTQGFERVKMVTLEMGVVSLVEPDALRFCFEAVSRDTLAEGAAFELVRTKGTGSCLDCGRMVEVDTLLDDCPFGFVRYNRRRSEDGSTDVVGAGAIEARRLRRQDDY
jgi:hydrogenase nickel incorporation protein HypA/HybF